MSTKEKNVLAALDAGDKKSAKEIESLKQNLATALAALEKNKTDLRATREELAHVKRNLRGAQAHLQELSHELVAAKIRAVATGVSAGVAGFFLGRRS